MAKYSPPTKVVTLQIPYLALVVRADPDWAAGKHRELEYPSPSGGRPLYADPYVRGSYNHHSNVYAVGQPFGGDDPDVVANSPLFSGVPTGSWA